MDDMQKKSAAQAEKSDPAEKSELTEKGRPTEKEAPGEKREPEKKELSPTWAQECIQDIDDWIESQGIYLRQ